MARLRVSIGCIFNLFRILSLIVVRAFVAAEEQEWSRPELEPIAQKTQKIVFQQIDIEETSEAKYGPVLRVFGITEEGYSILAHIRDFLPYFWVGAPRGFTNNDCKPFGIYLNVGWWRI